MAANPPREGLEFVPGDMDEVGVELLKHVDDPQDVIAYAGYGFWAPAAAISKVKGAKKQELTNAPIAPRTAPYVDDSEYVDREVDEHGQPKHADPDSTDVDHEANAPFPEPEGEEPAEDADAAKDPEHDEAPADAEKPKSTRARKSASE